VWRARWQWRRWICGEEADLAGGAPDPPPPPLDPATGAPPTVCLGADPAVATRPGPAMVGDLGQRRRGWARHRAHMGWRWAQLLFLIILIQFTEAGKATTSVGHRLIVTFYWRRLHPLTLFALLQ
jgi:hypothetical protein